MLSSKFSHVNGHSTSLHTCLHFVPLTPSKSTNPLFPPLKGSCNSVPYTFVALYFVLALQSLIYLDAPLQWCLPLLCPDQTPFVQTRPFVVLSEHISYTLSSSASLWPLQSAENYVIFQIGHPGYYFFLVFSNIEVEFRNVRDGQGLLTVCQGEHLCHGRSAPSPSFLLIPVTLLAIVLRPLVLLLLRSVC